MTKLKLKIKKALRRFKDFNGASIAVLIFLSVFAISAIAVFQSQRTTTSSRASDAKCPAGIGTYTALAGCEQVCGAGNCRSCLLSTTTKYYCDAAIGGGSGGSGTSGYNLPKCTGYNTSIRSTCEKEFGEGKCGKCTNDGSTVRWHQGADTPSGSSATGAGVTPGATGTQKCTPNTCANWDSTAYTSNKPAFYGEATKGYYDNLKNCQSKKGITQSLAAICGTATSTTQKCDQTTCSTQNYEAYPDNEAYIFTGRVDGLIYSSSSNCENRASGTDTTVLDICGDPDNNTLSCAASKTNCRDCPSNSYYYGIRSESDTRYYPGTEAGLKSCDSYIKNGTGGGFTNATAACACPTIPPAEEPAVIVPDKPKILDPSTCIFQGKECKAKVTGGTEYFPLQPCPKNYSNTNDQGVYEICQPASW